MFYTITSITEHFTIKAFVTINSDLELTVEDVITPVRLNACSVTNFSGFVF